MKRILFILLSILSLNAYSQTRFVTDTVIVKDIKAKVSGKINIKDTIVLKDGTKQTSAFTNALKSNYNTAYTLSHNHTNFSVLSSIKASDTIRWAQGGGTMTSKQIIDSITSLKTLTSNISFKKLITDFATYTLTDNLSIGVDTVSSFSGSSSIITILGLNGKNIYHAQPFSPIDTNQTNRTIKTTTGTQYQFLYGCFGNGNYRRYKFNLIDSSLIVGAPITLSAPSVSGSSLSTSSLRFSWTNITNNSGYTYKVSTDNGSTFGSPTNLSTNTTSFDITGLTTGTRRDVQVLTIGNGTTYLSSVYSSTANATTSALTTLGTPTLSAPTVISSSEIDLAWSQVTNNSGYKVQRSPDGTTYSDLTTTTTGTNSYNNTGLTASTIYYYKVKALGDGVTYIDGSYSTTQNATTSSSVIQLVSPTPTLSSMTVSGNDLLSSASFSTARTTFQYKLDGSGRIECDYIDDATNNGMIMTFGSSSTNSAFGADWKAGFYFDATSLYQLVDGNTSGATSKTGVTKVAIERLSDNSVILQKYNGSWSTVVTLKSSLTGTLYIHATANNGKKVSNPVGISGVTSI